MLGDPWTYSMIRNMKDTYRRSPRREVMYDALCSAIAVSTHYLVCRTHTATPKAEVCLHGLLRPGCLVALHSSA
jgi:hypothetical protein